MKLKITLLIFVGFVFTFAIAQPSEEELSIEAANPLADLMSFPFQNNLNMNYGPFNRNLNVLNIQPVIPFANGKLITRTIMPIVSIPDFTQENGMESSGLGDIVFTAFYVPKSKGLMWGFGPVIELPTGGSIRGTQKWNIGPSLILISQKKNMDTGGFN